MYKCVSPKFIWQKMNGKDEECWMLYLVNGIEYQIHGIATAPYEQINKQTNKTKQIL